MWQKKQFRDNKIRKVNMDSNRRISGANPATFLIYNFNASVVVGCSVSTSEENNCYSKNAQCSNIVAL
jgi:hypothetical protein